MADAFARAKETFKGLSNLLRLVAAGLGYGFFDTAWTMSEAGEYLAALVMVSIGVVLGLIAVYGWSGFSEHPKLTQPLKWFLRAVIVCWGAYSAFVIWRNKGQKPWTNITRDDLHKPGTYLAYLSPASPRTWGILAVGVSLGILIAVLTTRRWKRVLGTADPCPYEWTHLIAQYEKENINQAAMLLDCSLLYKELDGEAPYVNFNFQILNLSVFSICVGKSVEGWVEFASRRLGGNLKRTDTNGSFPHRTASWIVVTQWLSKEDVAMMRNSSEECAFGFEHLDLTIEGAVDTFPSDKEVVARPFKIKRRLERDGRLAAESEYLKPKETQKLAALRAENESLAAKIGGLTAALSQMPRAMGSRQPGRTSRPSNPVFVDVTIDYLMDLFVGRTEAEGQRLIAPYRGKWLRHAGSVVNVHEYGDRTQVCVYVTIKSLPGTGVIFINGYEHDWKERASVLKIGDEVAIEGEIETVSATSAFITEAAFTKKAGE